MYAKAQQIQGFAKQLNVFQHNYRSFKTCQITDFGNMKVPKSVISRSADGSSAVTSETMLRNDRLSSYKGLILALARLKAKDTDWFHTPTYNHFNTGIKNKVTKEKSKIRFLLFCFWQNLSLSFMEINYLRKVSLLTHRIQQHG